MILGDKKTFAIEATLVQGHEYVFINYCYWVLNNSIGDYQQPVLLSSAISNFENILEFAGHRSLDEDIYNTENMSNLLVSCYKDEDASCPISDEKMFYININYSKSENMDGYYTFLVETKSFEWLIFGDIIEKRDYNIKIPKGKFYRLIILFLDWIKNSVIVVLRKRHE